MIKITGSLMIMVGCFGMGLWYKRQFTGRVKALRLLQTIMELLCSEIRYGRGTLPESCGRVALRLTSPCQDAFRQIAERMKENSGESFEAIFRECLEGPLGEMPLTEEDMEEFFRFVSGNGFMDGQMQIRMIEQSREQLEAKAEGLERENAEKCRMAVGLGAMSGLMIILVLC